MRRLRALLIPSADGPQLVGAAPVVAVRTLLRRFWPDARPYRGRLALGLLLAALVPAIEAVEIYLFKLVVDDVLVPRELAALAPLAAAYVGLALASGVLSFADGYLAAWVGERFLLVLRTRVFAHVQGLSSHALDGRRLGDVLQRLTSDVQAIEAFVLSGLGDGVSALLRILFFGGALFLLSWQLALVSLVVAPLFFVLARHFSRLTRHAAREKRRRSGSLGAVAEESLGNAALVQALGREADEVARFRAEGERIVEAELAATRIRGLFTPLVDLIELAGVLVVIALGTWALAAGQLTLGGLLVFLAYLSQLYGPVRDLAGLANRMFAAAAGAERVLELLEERPAVTERPGAIDPGRARGAVELRGVTFRYPGASRDALRGLSLAVDPGRTVALTGPSGAGKSTVARLLLRFDDPGAGAVLLDGRDLRDLTLAGVRGNVALVAQEVLLPDVSVHEAIAQGRAGAGREEVEAAARAAGALDFITALPAGFDTRLGQRGRRLSGGQRQRLAIARALVRDAPVLVLDEPTTGLDAAAKAAVLGPLRALAAGRTTLVVTHDPDVLAWADEVVELAAPRGPAAVAGAGAHVAGADAADRAPAAVDHDPGQGVRPPVPCRA
ncbi:MAG TPA: ABC transporter ATP-binding protein [Solirubrobacteraceae bacterium]|nr:ABC transporter ATP-binding protein [Solirubrobacteraceae bacterium]